MDYHVTARRVDDHGGLACTKQAEIVLDTDLKGRADAFNPVELLLAALAACMLKGAERMIPLLDFRIEGVEIALTGSRQDAPPKLTRITYEIVIDSDESDHRLRLLHKNILKYGTISNTLSGALTLTGSLRRKDNHG